MNKIIIANPDYKMDIEKALNKFDASFCKAKVNRNGYVNRWIAIDIIRLQSELPLFIIVWSTNEVEIKLKLVDKIVYPTDIESQKGLIIKKK